MHPATKKNVGKKLVRLPKLLKSPPTLHRHAARNRPDAQTTAAYRQSGARYHLSSGVDMRLTATPV
jgi:hypothetical protein